jgi:two-component system sensor kinase FixL
MSKATASNPSKLSVIIVDDDEPMRRSVERVLMLDGYHVDTASSGRELLSREGLGEYFAILLDRKLPDGDAGTILSDVRERAPHAAILIVTGHADMDSTIAAIRHGVDDYLIKPVEPETLRMRLSALAELYRVRQELRESESRMRFLVENLPAGAVFVNHDDLFINRAGERLTGYPADEISTVHNWFRVLCHDRYEECFNKYRDMQDAGFKLAYVLPIIRKDGVARELKIAGHRYDHHEVWLVTDVTELHDAQRQLVQSERLAAIGQMVTGLAHESRNALQRARGCLDLLELDLEEQPQQLNLISRIRRALGDLQRNYEEVKQYAAPITLDRINVEIGDIVQSAFDDLCAEFDYSNVKFVIDRQRDSMIKVDAHRIGQLFRNILENAIAASNGKAEIRATVRQTAIDGRSYLECVISDRGQGMSQETLTRVFEPFYTTKNSGTGLGMAICKRIIDAHEGRIEANSELNRGTEITILLPL